MRVQEVFTVSSTADSAHSPKNIYFLNSSQIIFCAREELQAEGRAVLAGCVHASPGDVLRCGSHPCGSAPGAAFIRKDSFAL